ncbi:hypothetical protein T4B_946 [Trichinella pseudospiralis]|uniref:Uncharacterized protein n=1 Tax=Trichinella pseudospiralis TaxID=6337 RepID=A0A0V1I508_TRIPS|nr:hypothetical protein T4B_946 [Trichinella pseudospiralis]
MGFKNDNQVRFPVEFLPQFTNDSAEQEQPLRDCPSQRFNKPDSYHNLFIVSWITRVKSNVRKNVRYKMSMSTMIRTMNLELMSEWLVDRCGMLSLALSKIMIKVRQSYIYRAISSKAKKFMVGHEPEEKAWTDETKQTVE